MDLLARVAKAFTQAELAWGYDAATGQARPRACQLEARIAVGEAYVAVHPQDPRGPRLLAQLQAQLVAAQRDPVDRRRCQVWQQAYAEYTTALAEYEAEQRGECAAPQSVGAA